KRDRDPYGLASCMKAIAQGVSVRRAHRQTPKATAGADNCFA
ncbi:MAG: hypothetical protein QOE87_4371, partial [Gaiellales bacterium]|nr:hypothetical protein [Gaiellales bacterium]